MRNEKISFKIRQHSISRVPYQLIIGDREMEDDVLSVRSQSGEQTTTMTLGEFVNLLQDEITNKSQR